MNFKWFLSLNILSYLLPATAQSLFRHHLQNLRRVLLQFIFTTLDCNFNTIFLHIDRNSCHQSIANKIQYKHQDEDDQFQREVSEIL